MTNRMFFKALAKTSLLRTRQALSVVRLKPFTDASPEGLSKERYRRIALTSFSAIAAKGIAVVTSLISVPLTLHYLGNERYGMWMTISSLIAMFSFADLGMGNGLINKISEANGREDVKSAQVYISSTFFLLSGIASFILLILLLSYSSLPWGYLFNLKSSLALQEVGPATAIMLISLIVNMPLGIVQRIQIGYQEAFITNIWLAVGSLLGLIFVLIAVYTKAGLPWLVLAMSGGPVLATFCNWLFFFLRSHRELLPQWKTFKWDAGRSIAGTGVIFLILQILTLLGNTTDNIVIAQILGSSAVAGYAVTQKLFSITMLSQYFITPLWPAFGEAMARSDHEWAKKTLNRAIIYSIATGFITALPLLFFGKQIIVYWVGTSVAPSTSLLIGFSLWVILASYGGVMSTFLNSGNLLYRQTWFFAISSISALFLKFVLVTHWNVAGVIWATVIAYSLFYVIPAGKLAFGSFRLN